MKTSLVLVTFVLGCCLLVSVSNRLSQVFVPQEWDKRNVEMIEVGPPGDPYIRILGTCTLRQGDRFEFRGELPPAQPSVVLEYVNASNKGGCPDGSRVMFPAQEYYVFNLKHGF